MNHRTASLILLGLGVAVVISGVLPVQLLYASSGSMEPAISEGDLYVVIDTGRVTPGDIIAFESQRFDELVTHRVVDRADAGYITKGDANPSTDQQSGHQPVTDETILGEVLTVAGQPVIVPGIGPTIAFLHANRVIIILGLIAVAFLPELLRTGRTPSRPERRVKRVGDLIHPLLTVAVVGSFFVIYWGSSQHDMTYVATAGQSAAAHTVPVGESVVRSLSLDFYVPPLTTVIVDADGVSIIERSVTGSTAQLRVQLPARPTPGPIHTRIAVRAYPATLPRGVLAALDDIHWTVAALGSMLPVFGPVIGLYVGYVDPEAPIRWPRNRLIRSMEGN